MAGLREIKRRLKSVQNTKKITSAMKLVSAAKLRKAQIAVQRSREYTTALTGLLTQLSEEQGVMDVTHPLMEEHKEVKTIRFLIVGGSRGLCGAYNTNVNKRVDLGVKEIQQERPGIAIEHVLLGRKPAEYFRRIRRDCLKAYEQLPEDANFWPIDDVCKELEIDFLSHKIDEVYLIYTKFKSALSQTAMLERLLPMGADLTSPTPEAIQGIGQGVTLFEPSAMQVFSAIVPRVLRSRVRQACLDAKASEHGSRMAAMDAATKNASDLSDALRLKRNKVRQSGITADLLDIIGGAEALN